MGEHKKVLFSDKVIAGSRTYFMDIKESVQGAKYLVISESRDHEKSILGNRRIMVFEEHLLDFYNSLRKAISYFILHDDFPITEEQEVPCSVDIIRKDYPKAYAKWTDDEDDALARLYIEGKNISKISELLQRQPSAIRSRLQKIGLL